MEKITLLIIQKSLGTHFALLNQDVFPLNLSRKYEERIYRALLKCERSLKTIKGGKLCQMLP